LTNLRTLVRAKFIDKAKYPFAKPAVGKVSVAQAVADNETEADKEPLVGESLQCRQAAQLALEKLDPDQATVTVRDLLTELGIDASERNTSLYLWLCTAEADGQIPFRFLDCKEWTWAAAHDLTNLRTLVRAKFIDKAKYPFAKPAVGKVSVAQAVADNETEADQAELGVVSELFGPEAQIRLWEERCACPRNLLPEDAELIEPSPATQPMLVDPSEATLAEAQAAGHSCAEAPAFLGSIPAALALPEPGSEQSAAPWQIMLIVGPSGSGKTSLLRSIVGRLNPEASTESLYPRASWTPGLPLIEHFNEGFEEAQNWLCGVGLSSVPSWCKPFSALSLGEQYRANVARRFAEAAAGAPLVFDEWTSELDRGVARSVCSALKRRLAARRAAGCDVPPLLLATCHEDVVAYLRPDVLIRCSAGTAPTLEYDLRQPSAGPAEASGQAAVPGPCPAPQRLRGVFRGDSEPQPPGGTMLGRWIMVQEGDEGKVEFSIRHVRLANGGRLDFDISGFKNIKTLCRGSERCTLADAHLHNTWLEVRNTDLNMDTRIKLLSPGKLAVQVRSLNEAHHKSKADLETMLRLKRDIVALVLGEKVGEKTFVEQDQTYKNRWPKRRDQMEKVHQLTPNQARAMKVLPKNRTPQEAARIKQWTDRLDGMIAYSQSQVEEFPEADDWGPEMVARCVPTLTARCVDWIVEGVAHAEATDGEEGAAEGSGTEPQGSAVDGHLLEYGGRGGRQGLQAAGWYLPVEIRDETPYPGLRPSSIIACAPDFRRDPRKEAKTTGMVHLASYVGEGGAELAPLLEQAARFLDNGFDGLCVHAIPDLRRAPTSAMSDFATGVLLGPSGSGKTTLATERFAPPFSVQWDEYAPALAHFPSLAEAVAALEAVALELRTALRPVGLLSGGERERLTMARGLAEWASGRLTVLVLDEFTSLLDRATAKRVAKGIAGFVRERPTLKGLILSGCHSDVVGAGLVEPDWVFECGSSKLLIFEELDHSAMQVDDVSDARKADGGSDGSPDAKRRRLDDDGGAGGSQVPTFDADVEGSPIRVDEVEDEGKNRAFEQQLQRIVSPQQQPKAWGWELVVRRAMQSEWRHFREHHYKDHCLNSAAVCFVGELEGRAVVFLACLNPGINLAWSLGRNIPSRTTEQAEKMGVHEDFFNRTILREHRTVVMPDSQGLGIGSLMADVVAYLCQHMGITFMSTTAHPTYGGYRDRSPFWAALPTSQKERSAGAFSTFSHIWVGSVGKDGTVDPERERLLPHRIGLEGNFREARAQSATAIAA